MRKTTKHWLKILFVIIIVPVVIVGGGWFYYRWRFPYGYSHSCDIGLWMYLRRYADDHDGAYPAGEATPEASLSLLYPEYTDAEVLRGKTVPFDVVESILKSGGRLGPDTCGWHYVEGLRTDDDPRLALFWDKVAGLGHNGQRIYPGTHLVFFNHTDPKYITGSEWPAFLEEQEKLLAECKKKRQQQQKQKRNRSLNGHKKEVFIVQRHQSR